MEFTHVNAGNAFKNFVPKAVMLEESDRHVIFRIPLGVERQRRGNFFQIAAKASDVGGIHNVREYIVPSKDGETSELKSKMTFNPEDFPFAFVCFARKPLTD